jgi:hypothetical protein
MMTTIEHMARSPCAGGAPLATVSLEPASAYEAVTRQMVLAMSEELKEIKARLNGLLFMVAGSVLLDVALRLGGG